MVGTRTTAGLDRMVHSVWFDLVTLELRFQEALNAPAPNATAAADHSHGTPGPASTALRGDEEWLRAYV